MDKQIKKKWVEALRSGKYNQTYRTLFDGLDGFCCLGVLCDLRRKELKIKRDVYFDRLREENDGDEYLPNSVANWAKVGKRLTNGWDVSVIYKGKSFYLSTLNDDYDLSFEEIAIIIEEQL